MDHDRLLVIGASGLVGSELIRRAQEDGHAVLGVARAIQGCATDVMDLLQPASLDRVLSAFRPSMVAVCAAYPYVDGCELDPARSEHENVDGVRALVRALEARTKLIYYSTDHVFDGRRPSYVESDQVHPLNTYARHKRMAEEVVSAHGASLVVRTAWVFGAELRRKNFVYRVIDAARSGSILKVPARQAGCPTWTGWLATSTLALARDGCSGIVHLAGDEPLTKAEWAQKIIERLHLPHIEIVEVEGTEAGQVAPRPERVVLKSERHGLHQPPLDSILDAERVRLNQPG